MQYFLNIAGRAEGPFDLEEIRDSLNAGEIDAETLASTDGTENWVPISTLLNLPQNAATQPAAPAAAAPALSPAAAPSELAPEVPPAAREYLQSIRATTCYGVLRAVVDVAFVLLVISAVLGLIGAVLGVFAGLAFGNRAMIIGGAIASFCVTVVLLVTVRQAAQLVIDVADTLLHHHARHLEK